MEKLFHLKENGTNVKTEVMAGITTFLAMAYILAVNPSMLGDAGMNSQGVFMATALAAAVATIAARPAPERPETASPVFRISSASADGTCGCVMGSSTAVKPMRATFSGRPRHS